MKLYWLRVKDNGEGTLEHHSEVTLEERGNKKTKFTGGNRLTAIALALKFLEDKGEEVWALRLLRPGPQDGKRLYEIETYPNGIVSPLTLEEAVAAYDGD